MSTLLLKNNMHLRQMFCGLTKFSHLHVCAGKLYNVHLALAPKRIFTKKTPYFTIGTCARVGDLQKKRKGNGGGTLLGVPLFLL